MSSGYRVIERLSEDQARQLHALYQGEWWSRGRTPEEVGVVLEHSDFTFGMTADESPDLIAFARVLTDRVFKALIFDVIVHPTRRGTGLGAFLVARILEHPVIARVKNIELYCLPDRVEFYRRLGFSPDLGDLRLMRRVQSAAEADRG